VVPAEAIKLLLKNCFNLSPSVLLFVSADLEIETIGSFVRDQTAGAELRILWGVMGEFVVVSLGLFIPCTQMCQGEWPWPGQQVMDGWMLSHEQLAS
jgi:hypothetical protein